jgi:hypothetical protein
MKTRKYDGSDLRRVLAAMVTNDVVCARIASQWTDDGLFNVPWADLVGGMVVRHYRKYQKPPGDKMVAIFERWSDTTASDDKTVASVEKFLFDLSDMSDEVKDAEPQYLLDTSATVFNRARVERELEAAKLELERGDTDAAVARLATPAVNLGIGSYADLADDVSVWEQSFNPNRSKALVRYRGALGKFVGEAFTRGSFYSFMASEKVGKTTFLLDLLYRSARARCRVAFFDCGDSIQDELVERIALRASGLPRYPGTYKVPVEWKKGEDLPTFAEVNMPGVESIEAFRAFRRVCRNRNHVRLSCHPSGTLGVSDIEGQLTSWAREGWQADVVLVDYADILAPPKGVKDKMDQIDETWLALRRLSQRFSVFLCTATQVSALAYGTDGALMSQKHFQGRRTKFAHVNGILGINVSSDEKRMGMARINWIVRRGAQYNVKDFVRVVGCPFLGSPIIYSQR